MQQPNLSKLIDHRNLALWKYVNQHHEINVQFHPFPHHQVYTKQKVSSFLIPYNKYSTDSFTHELLHVYLSLKEVNTFGVLARIFQKNKILSSVITV